MAVNRSNLKQTPIPVVPRTMRIVNLDGTITRSGQALLEQLQASSTAFGPHANRPAPDEMSDGALYVEIDRGVIYSNQNGVWQYVAGTMFGTLSPDQRPTDLGADDGGFTFRGTDQQREFIWSQTAWIEVTPSPQTPWATDIDGANFRLVNVAAIGIGTASPSCPLQIVSAAGTATQFNLLQSGTASWDIQIPAATNALTFVAGGTEAVRITPTSGGFVGIGLTPTFQLQLFYDSAAKPGSSTWSVASDMRLKENIEPVKDDSLAILRALDWIRFDYNGRGNTPHDLKAIGLSAQELQSHLPEAVRSYKAKIMEDDTGESELLAIDYHHILVHSARAIQQLDADVKSLRAMLGKPLA
jgi:hypothetical protein